MRVILALLCAFATVSASAAEPPREHGPVLSGTVTDPDGRPVAARLWAIPDGTLPSRLEEVPPHDTETGRDGSFAIGLPPGRGATLYSCAPGFLPGRIEVPHPDEPVRLTLQPATAIQGVVLRPDGSPQDGARIWASQRGLEPNCVVFWHPCPVTPTATTDAAGRFEVAPLPPGWYDLFADAPGFVGGAAKRLRADAWEDVSGLTVHLQTGTVVTGRAVDPDGRPVPGVRINAYNGRGAPEALTGEDGSYRLVGVDQGEIQIVAETGGEQRVEWRIRVGQDEVRAPDLVLARKEPREAPSQEAPPAPAPPPIQPRADLWIPPVQEVTGRVVDAEGNPVPGVRLNVIRNGHLTAQAAVTRSDGSFAFHLVDGRFGMEATKPGYATGRLDRTFRVAGAPVDGLEIRLERSATIRGRVLGLEPGEVPVVHAYAGSRRQTGEVDPDGGFTIPDLDPGPWQIVAYLRSGPETQREVRHVLTILPGVFGIEIDLDFTETEEDSR